MLMPRKATVVAELGGGLVEVRLLDAARRALRPPDVDDHRLAAQVGEVDVVAVEVGAGQLDRGLAGRRGDLGRHALARDVALVAGAGQARAAREHEQAGEQDERTQELQGRSS